MVVGNNAAIIATTWDKEAIEHIREWICLVSHLQQLGD